MFKKKKSFELYIPTAEEYTYYKDLIPTIKARFWLNDVVAVNDISSKNRSAVIVEENGEVNYGGYYICWECGIRPFLRVDENTKDPLNTVRDFNGTAFVKIDENLWCARDIIGTAPFGTIFYITKNTLQDYLNAWMNT